jgi:hypothetical protein
MSHSFPLRQRFQPLLDRGPILRILIDWRAASLYEDNILKRHGNVLKKVIYLIL